MENANESEVSIGSRQEAAIVSLNNALAYLKVKAKTNSCMIVGPLHRFKITLTDPSSLQKIDNAKTRASLTLVMKASSPPIVTPNFSDGTISLDLMFGPHPVVKFADHIGSLELAKKEMALPILLGATNVNDPLIRDLAKMPHLLIAGTTGSGKTMQLHSIIASLMVIPDVKLALLDPKMVEFNRYDSAAQLAYDVSNTLEDCVRVVSDLESRMRARLEKIAKAGCKDIQDYRSNGHKMSYLVLVIDELADLVRSKKSNFSKILCSLAEKSRAVGIHIVGATQHPSADVITGPIKANFPSRIACKVATRVHSDVILGAGGADGLTGQGDALLIDGELSLVRFRGALVELSVKPTVDKGSATKVQPGLFGRILGAVMTSQAKKKD